MIGELCASIDVFPTALKAAGVELPARALIDGRDIFPVLADEANSYDCRAPQNVIEVIFNPCGPGDVTYAQEQEEILKRIENNTATSFDYVNYRFLIERNSPGDDGEE